MNNTLYISSRTNQSEYLKQNFEHVYFMKSSPSKRELRKLKRYIVKKNYNQIIIEDYFINLVKFVKKLNNVKVKLIWTRDASTLCDEVELDKLLIVIDLLKSGSIKALGFIQDNLYEAYKDLENVYRVKYTVYGEFKDGNSSNNVSIFGNAFLWQHNYFNQLSAIKMNEDFDLYMNNSKKIAERFCNLFNIDYESKKESISVMNFRHDLKNIRVLSAVYFSSSYDMFLIDSFNNGVPVLLGNNTLFFKGTKLEKYIIVSSDDDIEEISNKLTYIFNNNAEILSLYKGIKKEYDKEVKELLKKFLEG